MSGAPGHRLLPSRSEQPLAAPALVAVAHGSRDDRAAVATRRLLARVRERRPDLDVRESYLDHAEPGLADVLSGVPAGAVVVPLLLAAAYHSTVDIPGARAAAEVTSVQADVLGPDPLLLRGLERRLAEIGVATGDPGTAVVLAAAGSTSTDAVAGIRASAASWRAAGWWDVEAAFASAATPSVEDVVRDLRRRGAPRVAVASYLLFPGFFADRLAAAGADVTSPVLGDANEVVDLVLTRFDGARA